VPFFPEFLFQLSSRDQQVTWLDPFSQRIIVSALSLGVEADAARVPLGKVLLLQSVAAQADPGAGQLVNSVVISLRPQPNGPPVNLAAIGSTAVDLLQFLNWSGSIIVPSEWLITANSSFNAAVAANQTVLDVIGMLIPVGNIQRV